MTHARLHDEPGGWRPGRVLVAIAAFCVALTIFLAIAHRLHFSPTPKVAIGRVTLEGASKARDYVLGALFYLLVPLVSVGLDRLGLRTVQDILDTLPRSRRSPQMTLLVSGLVALPFLSSPLMYLTTRREGWAILFPLALSQIPARIVAAAAGKRWLRELFSREMGVWNALLVTESASWLLFRYVHNGTRIAHEDTLSVEWLMVALFCICIPGVVLSLARAVAVITCEDSRTIVRSFATGLLPLVLLPLLALRANESAGTEITVTVVALAGGIAAAAGRWSLPSRAVRALLPWLIVPAILFCANYASIASPWHWIDLFHRGESLGPASDYLRGKIPYRDVFVLHGLFDDGFLDAQLMRIFGRSADVSIARSVVFGAMISPALWMLGVLVFESMPLAFLTVCLGWVTAADNERAILELAAAALLAAAYRRGRRWAALVAGVVAALALFQSLEIGLYTVSGGFAVLAALALVDRRMKLPGRSLRLLPWFAAGIAAGAAPMLAWLAANGAFVAFFRDSFVTIPRIIDSVWSLPWPDLGGAFVQDLSLRGIALFLLSDKVRFVLNPAVLGIALAVLIARLLRRSFDDLDRALLLVTIFGILTQRSALGRADFPHQYFSAFFIPPALVILLVMAFRGMRRRWRTDPVAAASLAAALLAGLVVILWVPDLTVARIDETIRYRARISGRADLAPPAAATTADRLLRIHSEIDRMSAPGTPLFDFSNQPSLYFYLDRPNPTRFYQVPIVSPPELQREAIASLEKRRPPLVLRSSEGEGDPLDQIPNDARAPALAAYIDDHYRFAARRGGIEIWTRRNDPPPLRMSRYERIALEDRPTAPLEHFVFPSVASISGSAGASWRTDIAIHNPFGQPLPLRLRYVSGPSREARIELAPNQTWVRQDIVSSLFAAHGTLGALWIDYPPGRRPVATMSSYDASKNAQRSVLLPLPDAAKAVEGQQLVVLGLSPGGRRVNLGLLNPGATELVARIVAVDSDGASVGKAVERRIGEGESDVLADAEKALAVPFDPSVAIRVLVEKGEAMAWVSLVDQSTGESEIAAAVPSVR